MPTLQGAASGFSAVRVERMTGRASMGVGSTTSAGNTTLSPYSCVSQVKVAVELSAWAALLSWSVVVSRKD